MKMCLSCKQINARNLMMQGTVAFVLHFLSHFSDIWQPEDLWLQSGKDLVRCFFLGCFFIDFLQQNKHLPGGKRRCFECEDAGAEQGLEDVGWDDSTGRFKLAQLLVEPLITSLVPTGFCCVQIFDNFRYRTTHLWFYVKFQILSEVYPFHRPN